MSTALGLGIGLPFSTPTGGGGGGGITPSPARGFLIPQDTYYGVDTNIKPGGTNGTAFTISGWFFGLWNVSSGDAGSPTGGMLGGCLIVSDPTTRFEVSAGTSPGAGCTFETPSSLVWSLNNSVGVTPATDAIKFIGDTNSGNPHTALIKGQWNHVLVSVDTAAGKAALFFNDVDMIAAGWVTPTIAANCAWDLYSNRGLKLNGFVGTVGIATKSSAWYSEIWVCQQYLGDAGNSIPLATRRKFNDGAGHAVDLLADGSGPTGTQAAWYIGDRGDGVPTQRGAATAAHAYGACLATPTGISNYATGAPAGYGPGTGITSTKPVSVIIPSQINIATSTTTYSVTSNGQPVADGDFVVIHIHGVDGTNLGAHNPTVTSHTGFTRLSSSYDTWEFTDSYIFYKKLGVGEGNAAGITVTISQAVAFSGGVPGATVMYIFRNVSGVDQALLWKDPGHANTTQGVPAGNTTQAQALLSLYSNWSADPGASGAGIALQPTTGAMLHRTCQRSGPLLLATLEDGVGAGVSYVRNITRQGTHAADSWYAGSIGLVH